MICAMTALPRKTLPQPGALEALARNAGVCGRLAESLCSGPP